MKRQFILRITLCIIPVIATLSATATIAEPPDKPEMALQIGHTGDLKALTFSSDGTLLASGAMRSQVIVWDMRGRFPLELREFSSTNYSIRALVFSPDKRLLAAGGDGNVIEVWQVNNGRLLYRLEGHEDIASSLAFASDGRTLISAGRDGTVRLWSTATGKPIRAMNLSDLKKPSITLSESGNMFAVEITGKVAVGDTKSGLVLKTMAAAEYFMSLIAISPDGRSLARGEMDGDGPIELWDLKTGGKKTFKQGRFVTSIAFSPDGTRAYEKEYNRPDKVRQALAAMDQH